MLIQDPDRKIVKYFDDGKRYRITIKSSDSTIQIYEGSVTIKSSDNAVQIYEGSENTHICFALQLAHPQKSPLIGYAKHLGNEEHEAFPKYNWRNKQISGEAGVDLDDVVAWYRRYIGNPIVEEIR